MKPLRLVGTAPWLCHLGRIASFRPAADPGSLMSLVVHSDNGQVTGDKSLLQQSACYPYDFCCVVASLHSKYLQSKRTAVQVGDATERPCKRNRQ